MKEHTITYNHTNSYSTLNTYTENTINVWLVLHGMGYLSKYFIKYFKDLDPAENYIIAPQAPSKYYQDKRFKYVGASWLTKENRLLESENIMKYLDQVWLEESKKWHDRPIRLVFMGYSQGVSMITRWVASRKIVCDYLLLHSGAIPTELQRPSFEHLPSSTKVTYLYGDKDEYITEALQTEQQLKGDALFGDQLTISTFDGKHEVNTDFINKIAHLHL